MNDYIRDPKTGALFFVNDEKELDILEKRSFVQQIDAMRGEINTLKSLIKDLLAERN